MFRKWLVPFAVVVLLSTAGFAGKKKPQAQALTERDRAVHALNRFTFGARPGDVDEVLAEGVNNWFEQQLQPDSIPETVLDARLAPLRSLRMKPKDMVAAFPSQAMINQVAQGRAPMPSDPNEYSLYEVLLERMYQQKRIAMAQTAENDAKTVAVAAKTDTTQQDQERAGRLASQLMDLPKNKRMAALSALPVSDRITLTTNLRGDIRDRLLADFSPPERELFVSMNAPGQVVVGELQQGKLLRAIYSERQLQEVMTDFWFNHFNVYIYKDADQYLTTSFERDVLRPHALGKFRDLLAAVAHSPAMLFYLDNWTSVGPNSPIAKAAAKNKNSNAPGLNENYARELMELHTLGVDGGYTQADVIEVAKVFSGWTIQQPQLGGDYAFDPKRHEPGPKTVLGRTIDEAGEQEGMAVLDLLARSPATAKFVSTKLARRFVSDGPSPVLVQRMSDAYLKSDGDIREVLRAMFHSPEFWSPATIRAKVKSPLEFIASAVRATGSDVGNAAPLQGALNRMGEGLYQCQTPNGYPTTADKWLNTDALLDRLNFAMGLAAGKLPGVKFDAARVLALGMLASRDSAGFAPSRDGTQAAVTLLENTLLGTRVSPNTDSTIRKQLQQPPVNGDLLKNPDAGLATTIAVILGSPEFQRR